MMSCFRERHGRVVGFAIILCIAAILIPSEVDSLGFETLSSLRRKYVITTARYESSPTINAAEQVADVFTTNSGRSKRGKYPRLELWRTPVVVGVSNDYVSNDHPEEDIQAVFRDFGLHEDSITDMLISFPALVKLHSSNSILPKLRYLAHTIIGGQCSSSSSSGVASLHTSSSGMPGADTQIGEIDTQVINSITSFPTYFSFDLEKNIAPRHAYLCYVKVREPDWAGLATNAQLLDNACELLKCMLKSTDEEFIETFFSGESEPTTERTRAVSTLTASASPASAEQHSGSDVTSASSELTSLNADLKRKRRVDDYLKFRGKFLQGGLTAARNGDHELISLFLEHGWDPHSDTDRNGYSVLMWACANGKLPGALPTVRTLVEKTTLSVEHIALDGTGCMHWAATGGSLDICKLLEGKGCDPLVANAEGTTPLHWAAGSGCLDVLKWLLDTCGADIHAKNVFGCTVIHFASSGGQVEMCDYLWRVRGLNFRERNSHGHEPLTKAIAFKKNNVVKWLLDTIYPIDTTTSTNSGNNSIEGRTERLQCSLEALLADFERPRPWDESELTLLEIASLVKNSEGYELIQSHMEEIRKRLYELGQ